MMFECYSALAKETVSKLQKSRATGSGIVQVQVSRLLFWFKQGGTQFNCKREFHWGVMGVFKTSSRVTGVVI